MVAHFGMSELIGPVFYEARAEHPFLGQRLAIDGCVSDGARATIGGEIQRLLRAAETAVENLKPIALRLIVSPKLCSMTKPSNEKSSRCGSLRRWVLRPSTIC